MKTLSKSLDNAGITKYRFYICDDNSTDNTVEFINNEYPNAKIFITKGDCFWSKSMHIAMKMAKEDTPDFYLMINDDVDFNCDVIDTMLKSYIKAGKCCGIVGTTVASDNYTLTYGGAFFNKEGSLVIPNEELQLCEVANWNCFLIPKDVVKEIGIVNKHYAHSGGDYDYSLRMKKNNIPIYVASAPIGKCDSNSIKGTYKDKELNSIKRIKHLFGPKGYPFWSNMKLCVKANGIKVILGYTLGYLILIKTIVCDR